MSQYTSDLGLETGSEPWPPAGPVPVALVLR